MHDNRSKMTKYPCIFFNHNPHSVPWLELSMLISVSHLAAAKAINYETVLINSLIFALAARRNVACR